jgi:zinc transport system substrate-binding protein
VGPDRSPAIALVLLALVPAACGVAHADSAAPLAAGTDSLAPLDVFVSIVPENYFADRVGGDLIRTHVLVPPGQSPHTFEPTPQGTKKLAESAVYFTIGIPLEKPLLAKLGSIAAGLLVVDVSAGIPARSEDEGAAAATGGLSERDPHVWTSPRNAEEIAATMERALTTADPAHAATYAANLDSLRADLERLDADLASFLAPVRGGSFYVVHPEFGYFADAYGLHEVPLEVEGKEPGARDLAALVDRARSEHVRVVFTQPQFSQKTAEVFAQEIGARLAPLSSLVYDYPANLRRIAEEIRSAIEAEGDAQ